MTRYPFGWRMGSDPLTPEREVYDDWFNFVVHMTHTGVSRFALEFTTLKIEKLKIFGAMTNKLIRASCDAQRRQRRRLERLVGQLLGLLAHAISDLGLR